MSQITSLRNPRVLEAIRLRIRRHRRRRGQIIIDGLCELDRAVSAGVELIEVFLCPAVLGQQETEAWRERLGGTSGTMQSGGTSLRNEGRGGQDENPLSPRPSFLRDVPPELAPVEVHEVSERVIGRLAYGDRVEGIVAIAQTPSAELARLQLPASPLVVVLEGIEKPGNLGAIARSADAAGVDALIVADARTDLFNPNALRASLGTLFTLPVASATSEEVRVWLDQHGLAIHAARVDGSAEYTAFDYRGPTALVLGSEAHGLSERWQGDGIAPVRLPMLGVADSLNVSVTAAVLFYEARRQRSASPSR